MLSKWKAKQYPFQSLRVRKRRDPPAEPSWHSLSWDLCLFVSQLITQLAVLKGHQQLHYTAHLLFSQALGTTADGLMGTA